MKKQLLFIVLVLCYAVIAGGCGSGGSGDASNELGYMESDSASKSETESESSGGEGVADDSNGDPAVSEDADNASASSSKINTEMLIYTCNMSIDTLDYEKSVGDFRNMLSSVGGFVENETYSDGLSDTSYYIEETDKHKVYTATVRVPHDKYDTFVNDAGVLGDVRSKSSNVENVRQEYTDLNTTLQIYEAKEKRYIKMLAEITDDNHAVTVEKELTEIQVKIAGIKTRMNEIQEDVDYSTIDIQIREVTKYDEKPAKTDTFIQRLGNTVKSTWSTFLAFLETMLFLFIKMAPYLILLAIIIYVIYKIQKKALKPKSPATVQTPPVGTNETTDMQSEENESNQDEIVQNEMVQFEDNEKEDN